MNEKPKWGEATHKKLDQLVDVAGKFLGTEPELRSISCIEIALTHVNVIRKELREARVEIAKFKKQITALKEMVHKGQGMANEINILTKENKSLTAERDKATEDVEELIKERRTLLDERATLTTGLDRWIRIAGENQKSANLSATTLNDLTAENETLIREVQELHDKYGKIWDANQKQEKEIDQLRTEH